MAIVSMLPDLKELGPRNEIALKNIKRHLLEKCYTIENEVAFSIFGRWLIETSYLPSDVTTTLHEQILGLRGRFKLPQEVVLIGYGNIEQPKYQYIGLLSKKEALYSLGKNNCHPIEALLPKLPSFTSTS